MHRSKRLNCNNRPLRMGDTHHQRARHHQTGSDPDEERVNVQMLHTKSNGVRREMGGASNRIEMDRPSSIHQVFRRMTFFSLWRIPLLM